MFSSFFTFPTMASCYNTETVERILLLLYILFVDLIKQFPSCGRKILFLSFVNNKWVNFSSAFANPRI